MEKHTRHTGTFDAQDEQGHTHTIYVYTEFHQAETFGHSEEVEGLKEFTLANGQHVNHLGKGEYEIVETGQKLKSKSPDAP